MKIMATLHGESCVSSAIKMWITKLCANPSIVWVMLKKKVIKCIEMKARLVTKGSVLHAIAMSVDRLCRCHFCTRLPLCISYTLPKNPSIAKWIGSVSSLRSMYTQIIGEQQSPSLLIDTGFDWNLSSFPSVVLFIDSCLPEAVMVWWRENISLHREIFINTLSAWVPLCWVHLMTFLASGGNGDQSIFCNRTYIFHSLTDVFTFVMLIIYSCFLNLDY